MKHLITLIPFLLLFTSIHAQNKKSFFIDFQIEKAYFNSDFRCAQVIDKRLSKTNLGFAKVGLENKILPAKFPGDFSLYLEDKINNLFFGEKEKRDLVFIFHELMITEESFNHYEKGFAAMEIEIAEYRDSTLFSLGSFPYSVKENGSDVSRRHSNRLEECLINCIKQFYKSDWKNITGEPIDLNSENKYNTNQVPQRGLYLTFTNLIRENKMKDVEGYTVTKFTASNKIDQFNIKKLNKEKIKKVNFISTGGNILVRASLYSHNKHFIKAKHINGRYLYVEDKFSRPKQLAVIAFGSIPAEILSYRKKGIIIDSKTGSLYILTNKLVFELIKDYDEIYQEFKLTKRRLEDRERAIVQLNERLKHLEY